MDREQELADRMEILAAAMRGIYATRNGVRRMTLTEQDAAIYAEAAVLAIRDAGLRSPGRRMLKGARVSFGSTVA